MDVGSIPFKKTLNVRGCRLVYFGVKNKNDLRGSTIRFPEWTRKNFIYTFTRRCDGCRHLRDILLVRDLSSGMFVAVAVVCLLLSQTSVNGRLDFSLTTSSCKV